MKWNKIISFLDDSKEVGAIEASTDKGVANFKIIGRIWSWSANNESALRYSVENAIKNGIKTAKVEASSEGGSVFAAVEIVNLLKKFDDVSISVGALMASSMTYITSHFHTTIKANTQGMIHKPMSVVKGNEDQVENDLKLLKNITEDFAKAYANKTGKTVKDIKKLWSKGDYWMNAEELKAEGFVDEIEGEIEAFSNTDIMALSACGAPIIPEVTALQQRTDTNTNTFMEREEMIAFLGLEADSTDQQIKDAQSALKVDALKHREAKKQAKADEETTQAEKVDALVNGAVTAKKIDATQAEHFKTLATADFDSTKAVLDAMAVKPQLSKNLTPSDGSGTDPKANWSFNDYLENDPQALEALLASNPDRYYELEAARK